ncbi:C-GCAxxG-C-C family (seleno)protein [Halodesulfovibrio marinisediminis]|uniref:C_GCAxxG_C_C family probable redox protein n=1 Tax=Halodesulfovibrio marinisediminis DSM 17456 TaxID=1121457 RepID=A0A1N6HA25_9BACT|nr:C-GCAxxG-C-C family (seleno)protein [Halodesulfovibrio marinisediminis]SIO16654.1 C_GCAxxG_C_C family probable redox protein [Halodesulfovibrio marinisediminis DSM 17456]
MKLNKYSAVSLADTELSPEAEAIVEKLKLQAENLFETRALLCAEAVLVTLNEAFDGSLSEEEAINLGSTFCMGVGTAGCMCGALAGGLASVGMFTGKGRLATSNAYARECGKDLHDAFVRNHKSSCCRTLTRHVKDDSAKHFAQCTMLTGNATELAARIIIAERGGKLFKQPARPPLTKVQVLGMRIGSVFRSLCRKCAAVYR